MKKRKRQTVLLLAFTFGKCYIMDPYIENYEQSDDNKLLSHNAKTANGPRFNPIQDGPFRSCSFLGTFIPYLKKIKRPHKSTDTRLKFC